MDDLRLVIDAEARRATVLIDRPDRKGAFTSAMWERLPGLVAAACAEPAVRVLVVASATPGVFSAGADIGEYRDRIGDVEWGASNQESVSAGTAALRQAPLPVVAAVDGPAFGAGAGLVASCDVRLATARSSFAITPARLGMVYPFPDTAALVSLVGMAAARRILLTGLTLDAAEAYRIGLVDEVVDDGALDAAVDRWAAVLLANSRTSIALMKRTLALAATGRTDDGDDTRSIVRDALAGGDYAEGARSFLERRPPRFD
jgi:enoyl-CoA hydratase/carnithine racemase